MRAFPHLLRLLIPLTLASCQMGMRRTLTHEQLTACKARQVVARKLGGQLALRFQILGRDAFALGEVAPVEPGKPQATRLIPAYLDQGAYRDIWKSGVKIKVLGPEVWRRYVRSVTEHLAPAQADGCSLLCMENAEVVTFRDAQGVVQLLPLEKRPARLRITHTYHERELAQCLADHAAVNLSSLAEPVLLITGQSPPLVYLDPVQHSLTFLHAQTAEPFAISLLGLEKLPSTFTLRTASAVFWSSSFIAALNNPVSFLARGVNTLLSIMETMVHWRPRTRPEMAPPVAKDAPGMDLTVWERELDGITHSPPSLASVRLQINGTEFFPRYIEALQDARESADVRVFIFDNDDYAVKMADILREKAQQGLQVRIMLDELGSLFASQSDPESPMPGGFHAPEHITSYLKHDSRVQVRPLANPWLTSSHTKTFMIDGRRAWLGGMNLGREYRYDWHDLMVELEGPFVYLMQKDFQLAWAQAGPGGDAAWLLRKLAPERDRAYGLPIPNGAVPVRPLYTMSLRHEIETAQLHAIRRAQRRIWIETGYLTDHLLMRELLAARHRGVDVRVILPAKNDSGLIAASHLVVMGDLLANGIRVYAYPGMTHVKAALYDGWACLGSANLDRFSLRANHEFNIGFSAPGPVHELETRLFLADFHESKELHDQPDIPWTSQLADWLANEL